MSHPAVGSHARLLHSTRPGGTGLSLCLLLILLASGCEESGPKLYPVQGKVTFPDGEPVRGGTIELLSPEQRTTAVGQIEQDGSFSLTTFRDGDGTVAGDHLVIILQGSVPLGGATPHIHGRPVPSRYASYETSDLTTHVSPDRNNHLEIVVQEK